MIKVKEYRVGRRGDRGVIISLPMVWIEDNHLSPGDKVEFYRDEDDRLILVPKKAVSGEIPA